MSTSLRWSRCPTAASNVLPMRHSAQPYLRASRTLSGGRAVLCSAAVTTPAADRQQHQAIQPHVLHQGHGVLHKDISKVLFSAKQINDCLERLGGQIAKDYAGKPTLVLGVLKGGFMFTADLVRHVQPAPAVFEVDFIKASSYGSSTETSGEVKIDDIFEMASVRGKHVLVVEDIIDSGLTLSKIVTLLKDAGTASVRVCALLDKRARRKVQFEADYVGFQCPDEFVVGYGIDYAERYRMLPYVGVVRPEAVNAS